MAEQRRDNRLGIGVFLSTIHSVKGMEFNHVFILDGGWSENPSEEQRRLFYVAMTRAKETLCLLQRQDLRNPYLQSLKGDFILPRDSEIDTTATQLLTSRHYIILGLKDFVLSYASNFPEHHPIHQTLTNLNVGSKIQIVQQNGKLVVQKDKLSVAVLSKKAQSEWKHPLENILSVSIIAMITRYKTDSEEAYQAKCKVEQWEVPMIEVVLQN